MVPSSWASLWMEGNSGDSMASGMSGEFECEAYLEAASAAWLVHDLKTLWEGPLLKAEKAVVGYFVQCLIAKYLWSGANWSVTMMRLLHPCVK